MKKLILAAIAFNILAGAVAAQAAERKPVFDGYKFFQEVERYSGR